MESKPFASLSAGLLARKGAARPAMRRPHVTGAPVPTLPVSVQEDDLGWNDMGEGHHDAPRPVPPLTMANGKAQAMRPPVVEQQEKLEQSLARAEDESPAHEETKATVPVALVNKAAAASEAADAARVRASKAAFTLRLDPDRHLRLRLACAVGNRSAQQIVTQALDAFLEGQPQVEALARQVPDSTGRTKSN